MHLHCLIRSILEIRDQRSNVFTWSSVSFFSVISFSILPCSVVCGTKTTHAIELNRRQTVAFKFLSTYKPAVERFFHLKTCSGFQSHGKWPGAEFDRMSNDCFPGDTWRRKAESQKERNKISFFLDQPGILLKHWRPALTLFCLRFFVPPPPQSISKSMNANVMKLGSF